MGDTERPGTAEELGIAVCEGVDPSEVTIHDDGTHSGPPRFKQTDRKFTDYAGMSHHLTAMYCPCGHFIRRVTFTDKPELQTVRCEGSTMTVEEQQVARGTETPDTRQQILVAATGGGNSREVRPDTAHDEDLSLISGGDPDA